MTTETTTQSYEELWRKYDSVEQRLSAPLTTRMLKLAALHNGMHVLDVATGRGEPAIPAAKKVAPTGSVLGVDIDQSMLNIAQEKAEQEGVTNLKLSASNMETMDGIALDFFDVAFARWGLMYFQQPVQALRIIRKALKANGILVAVVWVDPVSASFFELPRAALSKITPLPSTNHDTPSTFYYSDSKRLTQDLDAAGFTLTHSELFEVDVIELGTDKELIDWAKAFGMSKLLQGLPLDAQDEWERELISAATPYRTKEGTIRLGGTSRIVVAQ